MIDIKKGIASGHVTDLNGHNFSKIILKIAFKKRTVLRITSNYTKFELAKALGINLSHIEDSSCQVEVTTKTGEFEKEGYGRYTIPMSNCKIRIIGHNNLDMIGRELYG